MSKINETITLNENEGLEIEFSKIVYNAPTDVGGPSRPSWVKATLALPEIIANVHMGTVVGNTCIFTEDDLEVYLKAWLDFHFHCGIKSFRWMWDKFRNCKAA